VKKKIRAYFVSKNSHRYLMSKIKIVKLTEVAQISYRVWEKMTLGLIDVNISIKFTL